MIVVGLTGSIGSGKSYAASFFKSKKIPVFSADSIVKKLLARNKYIKTIIKKKFPFAIENNSINKNKLAENVFKNKKELKKLEKIIHPKVGEEKRKFLKKNKIKNVPIVILEIPILFETKGNLNCDYTILMTINKKNQFNRIKKRKNMTKDKFDRIIRNQMSEKRKRQLADFIVNNSQTKKKTRQKLESIIKKILSTVL